MSYFTMMEEESSKPWFEAESFHSLKSNPHSEGCKAQYIQVNNEASIKPVQHVNTSRAILIYIFLPLVPLVRAGCTTTLHSFVSICNFEGLHKSSGDKAEMYWESSLWPLLASGSQFQFWNLNLEPIYLSIILTWKATDWQTLVCRTLQSSWLLQLNLRYLSFQDLSRISEDLKYRKERKNHL